jgi:outer membrane protein
MNRCFLLLAVLLFAVAVQAQEKNGGEFTLEKCISYALENSATSKNAAIDEQIAAARVKETRGIGLPQADLTVGVQHNIKLQRFFNQAAIVGAFNNPPIVFEGIDGTDLVAGANPFQLKDAGLATLSVNQILFNGSYLVGLQAAKAYRDLATKSTRQSKEELISQVTKAYYTALINTERMELFESNIARVDSLLQDTKALHENGFAEAIDVDRIRVALNNLKTERDNFQNLQQLSVELLKFQMNYPMDSPITLAGNLEEIQIPESSAAYGDDFKYEQRADFDLLLANRKLQALNLRNKYAEGMPSLVAQYNYGYSTMSNSIGGIFKTETGNSPQFNSNLGPDKWYSYSNVGVSLVVPLFSGLQRSYRVQQAKLDLQKVENNIQNAKSGIDLEIKQAQISYNNSLKSLSSQKENMALASNVARVTKIKYEQGVGSNIEVIDAETSLKESQLNYYNALYNALVAKVDLDKAYGKLGTPENNNK